MKNAFHIETIDEYNNFAQHKTLHPLVSVIDFSNFKSTGDTGQKNKNSFTLTFGFYAVFLKEDKNCIIQYGKIITITRKVHWYLLPLIRL